MIIPKYCIGGNVIMKKINVTIWNEFLHEKEKRIAKVYPEGIHGALAQMLGTEQEF